MSVQRFTLPYALRKQARILLDQQLWCLGCDLRLKPYWQRQYPQARFCPRPAGVHGSARLEWALGEERVSLWGFGSALTRSSGVSVLLRRYGFSPQLRKHRPDEALGWSLATLPKFHLPFTARDVEEVTTAVRLLASAFADYEDWLAAKAQAAYRHGCLQGWQRARTALPPESMAARWREIAAACERPLPCRSAA